MNTRFTRAISVLVVGVLLTALSGTGLAQQTPATPTKNLYDRLGGVYAIASVVDAFIERVLVNKTLNANPAIDSARKHVPKAGLKFQVTAMVCEATGGPCKYTGRPMKESHSRLNISEKEWDAMVVDFKMTLDQFKVPAAEQKELVNIVASTKPDIVTKK